MIGTMRRLLSLLALSSNARAFAPARRHITGATRLSATRGELDALTVPQLKELLRAGGFKVGGRKAELIDRILAGGGAAPAAAAPLAAAPAAAPAAPAVLIAACKS